MVSQEAAHPGGVPGREVLRDDRHGVGQPGVQPHHQVVVHAADAWRGVAFCDDVLGVHGGHVLAQQAERGAQGSAAAGARWPTSSRLVVVHHGQAPGAAPSSASSRWPRRVCRGSRCSGFADAELNRSRLPQAGGRPAPREAGPRGRCSVAGVRAMLFRSWVPVQRVTTSAPRSGARAMTFRQAPVAAARARSSGSMALYVPDRPQIRTPAAVKVPLIWRAWPAVRVVLSVARPRAAS